MSRESLPSLTDILRPRDASEVESAIFWAIASGKALNVVGRGSKRDIGAPARADVALDLSLLTGVTLYEPEELVLSARSGTPLAEIESLLASNGQQLAFEPMDFGPLLGAADKGSIGGTIAANVSGPRRIKAGAARDHFLGCSAVSGRGETFKSGGRVVKNVTGYDMCKLLAGSWGTLAAITDVTLKTLPRAETETTVAVLGLDDAVAVSAMSAATGSSCDVSAAAHLPASAAVLAAPGLSEGRAATVLRLEGIAPSVASRAEALAALMKPFGERAMLGETASRALWRAVRDVAPFAADGGRGDRDVWRISTPPASGAMLAQTIGGQADAEFLFDWAGGLVWAALAPLEDAGAAVVRAAVARAGGHATLVRASAAARAKTEVFEPQPGALGALSRRIKASFDPNGVLNPGRLWPDL